jgi:hypothetical protein
MKVYIVVQLNAPESGVRGVFFKEKSALIKMEQLKLKMPTEEFIVIVENVRTDMFNQ